MNQSCAHVVFIYSFFVSCRLFCSCFARAFEILFEATQTEWNSKSERVIERARDVYDKGGTQKKTSI